MIHRPTNITDMHRPSRAIVALGGLLGAAGIALAAAASHGANGAILSSAALVCLANGPALLALAVLRTSFRFAVAAAWVIAAGTALFSADIMLRAYAGQGLFSMAAPAGGLTMIAGWLLVAVGAFFRRPG